MISSLHFAASRDIRYDGAMNDNHPDVMRISQQPLLDHGTLVLAFSGWMDGGDVSTGTVERLIELTGAEQFAEIDPEPFFIYNFPGSMEVAALFRPRCRNRRRAGQDPPHAEQSFLIVTRQAIWHCSSAKSQTCTGGCSATRSSSWPAARGSPGSCLSAPTAVPCRIPVNHGSM